ncbi:MBL fold metallo-hydrolase [Phreatobacter stygius]|uniref:MBL fold metallo-hydrolase n=1 Tax=Phreatobacter stygius TaxID=1940610 RepID=A0A4D7B7U0_9HYPH|nr:MBL fold metallo-hydrolase [Phreatobacter stygius]QCI63987.1 MBL fold metallo-hydrolase [Phreatobacter stygius]
MSAAPSDNDIIYPVLTPPEAGEVIEIAPGVLWTRLPLPFRLNHVNIYLIEDGDGWAVLDTGIDDRVTRAAWEALVSGPLRGRRLTRLIVTHFHPDHIGLAGWLAERFQIPLITSQTSYLSCLNISLSPNALDAKLYRDFYLSHGLGAELTELVSTQGNEYLRMVANLPGTFLRIVGGDTIEIGGRVFSVRVGDGHAAEQIMLHCPSDKILFVADQVLAKITPNVSVWAVDPHGDPLGLFLRSLRALNADIPDDTLVLPGHQLPFIGIHLRSAQLIAHHESRCAALLEACREAPRSAADLIPIIFPRKLDAHQTSFAFSEVLAHVNYTLNQGQLVRTGKSDVVEYFAAG